MIRTIAMIASEGLLLTLAVTGLAWADEPARPEDEAKPPPASQPADDADLPNKAGGEKDKSKVVRFPEMSPEQAKKAVEKTRQLADQALKQAGLTLHAVETEHLLIYTDWVKNEEKWLTDTFEQVHGGLAKQFGADAGKSIWYGKLLAFAFTKQADFAKFSLQIEGIKPPASVTGFAIGGYGMLEHMVLWRSGGHDKVASVIAHESTHAFLARYRTNWGVPPWLNEGIAQWMVPVLVPRTDRTLKLAQTMSKVLARQGVKLDRMYAGQMSSDLYPVAMTMTDMLLMRSRASYVEMINDIKDGMDVEEAIKKRYGWTYKDLTNYWFKWAERGFTKTPSERDKGDIPIFPAEPK